MLAGVLVLAGSSWLTGFYLLPQSLLVTTGAANLGYGLYSFSLARRVMRPRAQVLLLVVANALWAVFCMAAAVYFATSATPFGVAHLLAEGVVVGWLAALEWRHRAALIGHA